VRLLVEPQVAGLFWFTASPNRKKQVTPVAHMKGARRSGAGKTCIIRFGADADAGEPTASAVARTLSIGRGAHPQ
jgi:hypothetical protein